MTEWLFPFLDPGSRTFWPLLVGAAGVAALVHLWRNRRRPAVALRTLWRATFASHLWRHPSVRLDMQLVLVRRALAVGVGVSELGLAYGVARAVAGALDEGLGVPALAHLSAGWVCAGYTLVLFVVWDLSRYLLHRAMHEIGPLWEIHQVHHTAEVLTPLTFHRVHPLEGLLYALRGVLVDGALAGIAFWAFRGQAVQWSILGVHGIGFLMNAISGNLRHSHVWWRFGPAVERWLLSPAQHQLHHARDQVRSNYGTWLAVWDRWAGSLVLAPERAPRAFGLSQANHAPDDLFGALLGPLRGAGRWWPWLGVVGATAARAEDGPAYEIVVVGEEGAPRVAGSAYVVDEDELEQFEYNDVHRVLANVPGVYVRGEDGFGLRPNIGMRGANSDRSAKITLLEDGIPFAPAPYAAPSAYYFPLTTRLTGVEVFKGQAALEHGPQTIGGAVNLLTRAVPERTAGAVDLGGGLYGTAKAHAWGALGSERVGVLLEGAHLSSGGFKELDGGGPTGFQRQDLMLKARAGGAAAELQLKLGYGHERSHETYLGLTYADWQATPYRRYAASQDDLMEWDRTQAELFGMVSFGRTRVDGAVWTHGLSRTWTRLNGFAGGTDLRDLLIAGQGSELAILAGTQDGTTPDEVLLIGTNDRTFRSSGVQSVLRTQVGSGAVRDTLTVGVRLMRDDVRRLHTEDPFDMRAGDLVPTGGATETVLDSVTRADAVAAWVHDDLDLGRVQILPGARLEWIRTLAGPSATGPEDPQEQAIVLPGIGLFAEAAPRVDVFAGVHRGFSPVAPGQAADVRPETAVNYEIGARARPGESRLEATGYWSAYDNLVGTCTLSGGCTDEQVDQQYNGGSARVFGVESLAAHLVHLPARADLALSAVYTFTHTEFLTGFVSEFPQFGTVEPGDELPYVPAHQGAVHLALTHPRVSFAVGASARSGMRDEAGQGPIPAIGGIPPLLLLDASASARLSPVFEVYANATNLTGTSAIESWRPFGARPVAPLQANIGIKVGPRP